MAQDKRTTTGIMATWADKRSDSAPRVSVVYEGDRIDHKGRGLAGLSDEEAEAMARRARGRRAGPASRVAGPTAGDSLSAEQLYRATRGLICAGWVEQDGRVTACAPILRRWGTGPGLAERLRRAGFRVEQVDRAEPPRAEQVGLPLAGQPHSAFQSRKPALKSPSR